MQPTLSHDDSKLAFTRAANGMADIWIHDVKTGTTTRLTTDPSYDEQPRWSHDGRMVAYNGESAGVLGVRVRPLDSSKPVIQIMKGQASWLGTFTVDDRSVVVATRDGNGPGDLTLVRLAQPDVGSRLTTDPADESEPAFSPDGRWLLFATSRSGRPEIALAPFRDDGTSARLGDARLVSSGGGTAGGWRKDGREIYYVSSDGHVVTVPVTASGDGGLVPGAPKSLFQLPVNAANWVAANSDLTRFVVIKAPNDNRQSFRILTHWK